MKLISLLALVIFLSSCHDDKKISQKEFTRQKSDTVLTSVLYAHNWVINDYRTVTAEKIIADTFALESVDSVMAVKKWKRDSIYVIQLYDTMKNAGKIQFDSAGKVKMQAKYLVLPYKFILKDYNKIWR